MGMREYKSQAPHFLGGSLYVRESERERERERESEKERREI